MTEMKSPDGGRSMNKGLKRRSIKIFVWLVFETGFLYRTALVVLELALYTRLALNSLRSACLCLPTDGIKGTHQNCLASMKIF